MTTTSGLLEDREAERRDLLLGRLVQSCLGTLDIACIYLGDRLGLYRSLRDGGPMTSSELAAASGTDERYVREWLEQQAAYGVLEAGPEDGQARRYSLPAGHAEVLV